LEIVGNYQGEAIACWGKWLGLKLRLVGRWNNRKSHYSVSETRRGIGKGRDEKTRKTLEVVETDQGIG